MKIIALILISYVFSANAFVLPDEIIKNLKLGMDVCVEEIGVSEDTANAILKNVTIEYDQKINCYSACFLNIVVRMHDDRNIDVDLARKVVYRLVKKVDEAEDIMRVLYKCSGLNGRDRCDTGSIILRCLIADKRFPKMYKE